MPILVVTIDTEEEGRWSSHYPAEGHTCLNIGRLERIQSIFDRLGVTATYLVDFPVIADPAARSVIQDLGRNGRSEVGAHLHPWCNPPFDNIPAHLVVNGSATFPHNLPAEIQLAKLAVLCRRIGDAMGVAPTSYRAGRWGFDHTTVPVLEQVGIRVDTSVTPLWWDSSPGGPAFARAPLVPYRLSARDACREGDSDVVEIPLTGVVVGPLGRLAEDFVRMVGPLPGLRRPLVALGFKTLRPELYDEMAMCALVDSMVNRGLEVLNVMFHSSVVLPGATPYVRDDSELNAFCARLEATLEHAIKRHGAKPLTLSQAPDALTRPIAPRSRLG